MKCKKCGEEVPENSIFCTNCGSKLSEQIEEPKEKQNQKENEVKEEVTKKEETKENIKEEPKEELKKDVIEEKPKEVKEEKKEEIKKETIEPKPKKKKSKLKIFLIIILILVVLAGGFYLIFREDIEEYFEEKEKSDKLEEDVEEGINEVAENMTQNETTENTVTEPTPQTIVTTDKREFRSDLAWCKLNNQWICINTEGKVVFKLPEEYTGVTDFSDEGYALIKKENNKAIIDETGRIITTDENNTAFDKIISEDAFADCALVSKEIDEYDKAETQYGIIDFEGNWILNLSADNEKLNKMTEGIGENIITDGYDKVYLVDVAKNVTIKGLIKEIIAEDDDSIIILDYDDQLVKINEESGKTTTIVKNVDSVYGKLNNDLLAVKIRKYNDKTRDYDISYGYYDVNGKKQVSIKEENVESLTTMSDEGYYGVITSNDSGTKFVTICDKEGNKQFDPIKGAEECTYLGEGRFFISYSNDTGFDKYVCDEKGQKLFNAESMTLYEDGFSIKDGYNYVDQAGMIMTIVE